MASKAKVVGPTIRADVLKTFNGDGDVVAWLQKAELVAKLTHVEDVASFVPLYLEGGALAVYMEMDDRNKGELAHIKSNLIRAFSDNQFVGFAKLRGAKWNGEPVDVFANELRRLSKICGFTGEGLEQIVKLAFVGGFPDAIALELQQVQGVETMTVVDLLGRARVLTANKGAVLAGGGFAAPAISDQRGDKFKKVGRRGMQHQRIKCFICEGGHYARECPEKSDRKTICFRCGGEGHIAAYCEYVMRGAGGRMEVDASGGGESACAAGVNGVPIINVMMHGCTRRALVDTGCSNTIVRAGVVTDWKKETVQTTAFDGRTVCCGGTAQIELEVDGEKVSTTATVSDHIVGDIDVLIGMDVITKLGGVSVGQSKIQFGRRVACSVRGPQTTQNIHENLIIEDKDFEASFDGKYWTITYFWKDSQTTPRLSNKVSLYDRGLEGTKKEKFDQEVDKWIEEGILKPWDGEVEGVIPLMAVEQPTKNKVRPVLDFRELNQFVDCHTGDELIDVCQDTLREWRKVRGDAEVVDLKAAYLQLHVNPKLWKYQLVQYKGQTYCLTRVGFGLNSAPRIMTKVLKTVLGLSPDIQQATSSYIDDILVDVSKVKSDDVIRHLMSYGLVAKPAEKLEGGTALGLRLSRDQEGSLVFSRNSEVPLVEHPLSKRELFSICGKLVGHYPIAGWLRVACSFVKRQVEATGWDDYIGDKAQSIVQEIVNQTSVQDPVRGRWQVTPSTEGDVWTDASDIAVGVVIETGGVKAEDGSWLRKSDDYHHINVAELDGVLKGINLGVKWGLEKMVIHTDSATVCGWINRTLSGERRVKTSGAAEILIKRRLATLKALVDELGLTLEVKLVASKDNKADVLTRVPRDWLRSRDGGLVSCVSLTDNIRHLHNKHHMGVERSLYLAKRVEPGVTRQQVKRVVQGCERCNSIDPAPGSHEVGELSVGGTWERVAIDVTHYHNVPYLTLVDCGPGRFAIWRELKSEMAHHIAEELNQIFLERGPVGEVLLDNGPAFRSEQFQSFLRRWNVGVFFRAAYRPSGNGIVERNHRTIKAMAERGALSPIDAVFYYNCSPRTGQKEESIPQKSVMTYEWRIPDEQSMARKEELPGTSFVKVGDEVWVKPGNARCTTQWDKGVVTKINSSSNIDVDHVPRHILDLRVVRGNDTEEINRDLDVQADPESQGGRYPQRERRAPLWQSDYVLA